MVSFLVFQFGYTTVFGCYSAFLFLRTGECIAVFRTQSHAQIKQTTEHC